MHLKLRRLPPQVPDFTVLFQLRRLDIPVVGSQGADGELAIEPNWIADGINLYAIEFRNKSSGIKLPLETSAKKGGQ